MKKYILLVCLCMITPVYASKTYDFINVKYIRNHDGDTIIFDLGNNIPEPFRYGVVRLYGIDTPEVSTKNTNEKRAGIIARDFAHNELVNAKQINLTECSKDKYFRILCRVKYDNKDLTIELLNHGYGYAYYGDKKNQDKINAVVKTIGGSK